MNEQQKQIITYAREVIDTPYRHQGRINLDDQGGILSVDCVGLVVYVAEKLGMKVNQWKGYGKEPKPDIIKEELDKHFIRVKRSEMSFADIVWLKGNNMDEAIHLGIIGDYYDGFSLIHAYNSAGLNKVVEHNLSPDWIKRINGVWRFP